VTADLEGAYQRLLDKMEEMRLDAARLETWLPMLQKLVLLDATTDYIAMIVKEDRSPVVQSPQIKAN
jgi:hypothetical protein